MGLPYNMEFLQRVCLLGTSRIGLILYKDN